MFDYEKLHLERLRSHLADCCVLLKKDGNFPLEAPCRLAAYGSGVRHTVKGGTGSGEVNSRHFVTAEIGLVDAGFTLVSKEWLDAYENVLEGAKKAFIKQVKEEAKAAHAIPLVYGMGAVMPQPEYDLPLDLSAEAAVYIVSRISGEGSDRKPVNGDFRLTDSEIRDIKALSSGYERFMLVINAGGPVDLSPVCDVGNILVLSQLGVDTGAVLADILLGKAVPSGKLATTWSAFEDYCPDAEFGDPDDVRYLEGVYVGYRWFDSVGRKPLFPFGYGLSYTEFSIDAGEPSSKNTVISIPVNVTNTGSFSGRETAQVYVSAPAGRIDKPYQVLAGFSKTRTLAPGESQDLLIQFDIKDCASYDESSAGYVLEKGRYIVRLGSSSRDTVVCAAADLNADVCVVQAKNVLGDPGFKDMAYGSERAPEEIPEGTKILKTAAGRIKKEECVYELEPDTLPAIGALSDSQLANLCVGAHSSGLGALSVIGAASSKVAGAAGQSCSQGDLPPIVMADGPAGLRLSKRFYRDEKGAHAIGGGGLPESIRDFLPAPVSAVLKAVGGGSERAPKGRTTEFQYCTAIPVGTAIAQSWDTEFAQMCGDIVGEEMERFGVQLWLAPALNIHRSVLCGRNFEYFSEDPLISGKMAAALTRGVQSHPGCGVTIKHYAANNQEKNRMNCNSRVSERAMREIYIKGFEICVKEAQPKSVMTSYNLLNGQHTSESAALIRDILRCEWKYGGIVMTDWVIGIASAGKHKYRGAEAKYVAAAGGDLFMPGSNADVNSILDGLKKGVLSRAQLMENASRVIKMAWELNK